MAKTKDMTVSLNVTVPGTMTKERLRSTILRLLSLGQKECESITSQSTAQNVEDMLSVYIESAKIDN